MRKAVEIGFLALALGLLGCTVSQGQVFDRLPEQLGGLPTDAPPRPQTPYQYPAVHDIPPPRAVKPLSDSQVLKLEEELKGLRAKQEKEAGGAQPPSASAKARSTGNAGKP